MFKPDLRVHNENICYGFNYFHEHFEKNFLCVCVQKKRMLADSATPDKRNDVPPCFRHGTCVSTLVNAYFYPEASFLALRYNIEL